MEVCAMRLKTVPLFETLPVLLYVLGRIASSFYYLYHLMAMYLEILTIPQELINAL